MILLWVNTMDTLNTSIEDTQACLDQARVLIESIDDVIYSRPVEEAHNASIGDHIRHTLDHYWALLKGFPEGMIDYDNRDRASTVATNREKALQSITNINATLSGLSAESAGNPVRLVSGQWDPENDERIYLESNLLRELSFCLSHTIHHFAIIGIQATLLSVAVPAGFGIAPSTLRFQMKEKSCAQ